MKTARNIETSMRPNAGAPRAWQRMLSGRRLDLLDPSPLDIEIEDIAHGLARVARWNGQTGGEHAFSVAQHSLLVETIVGEIEPALDTRFRLASLMHDAPEYVIGDLISPFKAALSLDYKAFELKRELAPSFGATHTAGEPRFTRDGAPAADPGPDGAGPEQRDPGVRISMPDR